MQVDKSIWRAWFLATLRRHFIIADQVWAARNSRIIYVFINATFGTFFSSSQWTRLCVEQFIDSHFYPQQIPSLLLSHQINIQRTFCNNQNMHVKMP